MGSPIPTRFVKEFMTSKRLKGISPKGTRPIDLEAFRAAIQETLNNPSFQRDFAQTVVKQVLAKG